MDAEKELIKILSEELAKEIDTQILHELIYVGIEDRAESLIRECNIDEILYDKSYTNQDIIDEINKHQNINLHGEFLEKLNKFINEKRGID